MGKLLAGDCLPVKFWESSGKARGLLIQSLAQWLHAVLDGAWSTSNSKEKRSTKHLTDLSPRCISTRVLRAVAVVVGVMTLTQPASAQQPHSWSERVMAFPYTKRLDTLREAAPPYPGVRYPFSFTYGGQASDALLAAWPMDSGGTNSAAGVSELWRTWTDSVTGLRVRWESRRHRDYADCEWVLFFENTGPRDTPILENVQALDFTFDVPLGAGIMNLALTARVKNGGPRART
ncbi:MAG: hypothetical protein AAB676_11645 [Verrucomicrobiota bacterium]